MRSREHCCHRGASIANATNDHDVTDEQAFLSWPDDLQALIDEVQTVEGLDALCCVASAPSRSWSFDDLVAEIEHDRLRVTEAVAHLVGKGLLEVCGWREIRFAHQAPTRVAAVHALVRLSVEDRPNVLGAIAHFSVWRIRSGLAGAFVPRRPRPSSDH
jgi:hypothetical protein